MILLNMNGAEQDEKEQLEFSLIIWKMIEIKYITQLKRRVYVGLEEYSHSKI